MPGKMKSLPVDRRRLNAQLQDRKLTIYKASEKIGYARNTLTSKLSSGALTVDMLNALWVQFGISYDLIKPNVENEDCAAKSYVSDEKATKIFFGERPKDELEIKCGQVSEESQAAQKAMYEAAIKAENVELSAMAKLFEQAIKQMRETLYNAVHDAVTDALNG